ncbi:polygalacturonase-like [Papaver somniferum]|uniref:polygalacturonase-like n=1 Tax=Papaver somniferum TaxID=3469 RepID=UPI000E6FB9BB|nr:polygalacturonase-like [Papaver somniferum]
MIIPGGRTYFLTPLTFKGHCESANILVKVDGNIVAPESPDAWNGLDVHLWISFKEVNGLTISGGGTIDGRGKKWWDQSCRYHPGPGCTKLAPTVLRFLQCDDCISIGDHIDDIHIDNINCGPGHGISIRSLGINGGEAKVQDIRVTNSHFRDTTNGMRIKTYQGGNGYAKDFYFKNLNFDTVSNPIIIDQYYCAVAGACPPQNTAVQIKNVTYEHFTGTSATQAAVVQNCSQAIPCTELTFNNIQLSPAKRGEPVKSVYINAHGERAGLLRPKIPCLLN